MSEEKKQTNNNDSIEKNVLNQNHTNLCKFKPESIMIKICWLFVGLFFGFLGSLLISHIQNENIRKAKIETWTTSTIREFDYNLEWLTNSPAFKDEGDSIPIKRYFSYATLNNFLMILPDLKISDTNVYIIGYKIIELIKSLNQCIDQRNIIKQERIWDNIKSLSGNIEHREKTVSEIDESINKLMALIRQEITPYKELLLKIKK